MQNLKENVDKLKLYLNNKSYNDIDIIDLIKYISNNYGTNLKLDKDKKNKLDNMLNLKQKVLLVLVDGMGYYKVENLDESSVLRKNLKYPMQTVNPTSTACILSSICSASYPTTHGIFGWWHYIRSKNINCCPLLYVERKTYLDLDKKNIGSKELFNFKSIFDSYNCTVNISMAREYINSKFSKAFIGKKANTHGFYSIKEAFTSMSKRIKETSKNFNYIYIDGLDYASHAYGTNSNEVKKIILEIEEGIKYIKNNNDDITVIVTADHGQVDMNSMLYLNQKNDYTKYFYALPSIDTRMISFFVKDEFKEEFEIKFCEEFNRDVILLKKEEIEEYHIFGNESLSKFASDNLGEYIAIVVNNKFMVCDSVNLEDKLNTKGNHSGLTKEETTIPLIVI